MVFSSLSEEGWMVPSATSPKRFKPRFNDSHKHYNNKATGEGRLSPAMSSSEMRIDGDDDYGLEATRKQLVFDLNVAADRMRNAILGEDKKEEEAQESPFDDGGSEKKQKCSLRERSDGAVKLPKRETRDSCKTQRKKLSVQLSREEVEEDYVKIVGRRLSRKPNKRPNVVQKQLDALFPGLLLTEVTADLYKVPDESPTRHCWKRMRNKNRKGSEA